MLLNFSVFLRMRFFVDQLQRNIQLPEHPMRIVSLVPSQTELLADLGLEEEVIGITKFCVHPGEWFRSKTRIGGTKTVNIELVRTLRPDLIIANKEENVREQINALEAIAPVWVSDVNNINDALQMIESIGRITHKNTEAERLTARLKDDLAAMAQPKEKIRTAYLIWKDPYMAAGGDTFISDVMRLAGFENVLQSEPRYPSVTPEILREKETALVMLSSEPYPFKQKHVDELQAQLPGAKIICVDGEIFSWYGSRMKYMKDYIAQLRLS